MIDAINALAAMIAICMFYLLIVYCGFWSVSDMMFLRWALCLIVHIVAIVARYPLAPIAAVFFTTNDKRHLLFPFRWLGTIDNDLSGDDGRCKFTATVLRFNKP